MRTVALVTLAFLASPVAAKSVYLNCTLTYQSDPPKVFQVTFDEEAGTFTYTFTGGPAHKMAAAFTADEVVASDRDVLSGGTTLTDEWRINRATGHIQRNLTVGSTMLATSQPPVTSDGTCAAVKAQPRKF